MRQNFLSYYLPVKWFSSGELLMASNYYGKELHIDNWQGAEYALTFDATQSLRYFFQFVNYI